MNFIYSEEELNYFVNLLPTLERDEVWFISLSCRNKHLIDEERKFYSLNRPEMFAREFIYETSLDKFKLVLEMLETSLLYRRTKSNQLFPEKAMIVYFNLNPSSGIKAFFEFQKEMNKEMELLVNGLEKNNNNEIFYNRFKRCMSILKSKFQTSTSRKIFVDVDFDIKKSPIGFEIIQGFISFCDSNNMKYFVIETKGGYHVCIKKETIHCNIQKVINELHSKVSKDGEVVFNKNEMIPLPGTIQAEFEVKIIKSTL